MKIFLACALLSSAFAAPAMAESFTYKGESYNYEVKSMPGHRVISGVAQATGEPFRLIVRGNKVSGTFGYRQVDFRAKSGALAAAGGATILATK